MANTASKKALRHGGVTVALTVLAVVAIVLLNASVTSLAMRYGWFVNMNPTLLYPVTDTCFDYLDTYVIPDAEEDIRIIFCDEEENIRADVTQSYVLNTAEELAALVQAAKGDIYERVERYRTLLGVSVGRVTIRCQRTKWGSCSAMGNLNFNCLLMLCPPDVRDFVVVHELCHRKEMNHSARFWKLVESVNR